MPHPGRSSLTGRTATSQTAQCAYLSGMQHCHVRQKVIPILYRCLPVVGHIIVLPLGGYFQFHFAHMYTHMFLTDNHMLQPNLPENVSGPNSQLPGASPQMAPSVQPPLQPMGQGVLPNPTFAPPNQIRPGEHNPICNCEWFLTFMLA